MQIPREGNRIAIFLRLTCVAASAERASRPDPRIALPILGNDRPQPIGRKKRPLDVERECLENPSVKVQGIGSGNGKGNHGAVEGKVHDRQDCQRDRLSRSFRRLDSRGERGATNRAHDAAMAGYTTLISSAPKPSANSINCPHQNRCRPDSA